MEFKKRDGTKINLATKEYVDSKDWVIKEIKFISNGTSNTEEIGTVAEIGMNTEKLIVAPFIVSYNSVPNYSSFVNEVFLKYSRLQALN